MASPTDFGLQKLTFDYKEDLKSEDFNNIMHQLVPVGVYEGLTLSKVDDATVQVDPGVMFLKDLNKELTVRVETTVADNITGVSASTPYLIVNMDWLNIETWFAKFEPEIWANTTGSIILGKAIYDGVTLVDFDTSLRHTASLSTLESRKEAFLVYPNIVEDNKVNIKGGQAIINNVIVDYPDTPNAVTLSDVTANKRIDVICIDSAGAAQVVEGSQSASPVIPTIPTNFMPIAYVTRDFAVFPTLVKGSDITQIRPDRNSGIELSDTTLNNLSITDSTNSTSKDTGALIIENGGLGVELDSTLGGHLEVNDRIGIGITPSSSSLEISGDFTGTDRDIIELTNTSIISNSTANIAFNCGVSSMGNILLFADEYTANPAFTGKMAMNGESTGGVMLRAVDSAGTITMYTNDSFERLKIDENGNVDIDNNTFYVNATTNRIGIKNNNPQISLHVGDQLSTDMIADNTIALFSGADTYVDIASQDSGTVGSALNLTQLDSTLDNFENMWSIGRGTSLSNNELVFAFGTNKSFGSNTVYSRFDSDINFLKDTYISPQLGLNTTSIRSGNDFEIGTQNDANSRKLALVSGNNLDSAIKFAESDTTDERGFQIKYSGGTNSLDFLTSEGSVFASNLDFTSVRFSIDRGTGNTSITSTTNSTDTTTGALVITGGLGVGDDVNFGGTLDISGITTITDDLVVDTDTLFVDASLDRVGFGTDTPLWDVHFYSGLIVGAHSETDASDKQFRLAGMHFTNAEEPVGGIFIRSDGSENEVNIGGGTNQVNAATNLRFFTASDTTTITGTKRFEIFEDGKIATGGEESPDCLAGGITMLAPTLSGSPYKMITLKHPSVNHGITSISETDTYGSIGAVSQSNGILNIIGLSDGSPYGLKIDGYVDTATTSNTQFGPITLVAGFKSGTSSTAFASNESIVVFRNNSANKHVFKGNGDIYTDTGVVVAFDAENDIKLVEAARNIMAGNDTNKDFELYKDRLEELEILKDGFMSHHKMTQLHLGTFGQLWNMIRGLAGKFDVTETELFEMAKQY
jgi:hypothetical protein